jgi:Mg2+-importing ATPase
VFVIRTHASPFWRGRPSPALIASALIGVAAAILLPYTPLAAPLGLTALPASYIPIVATLVVICLALVEVTKRAMFTPGDLLRPASPPTTPAVRRVHRRAARFTTRAGPQTTARPR